MHPNRKEGATVKINEDWLAVVVGFVLMAVAVLGWISPTWIKF